MVGELAAIQQRRLEVLDIEHAHKSANFKVLGVNQRLGDRHRGHIRLDQRPIILGLGGCGYA